MLDKKLKNGIIYLSNKKGVINMLWMLKLGMLCIKVGAILILIGMFIVLVVEFGKFCAFGHEYLTKTR